MVVLDGPCGDEIDRAVVRHTVPFPYVSGLLAFREALPLVHAFSRLGSAPDLIFVDGHGVLHPRNMGLASHLGILLDVPTIGCAKTPPLRKGTAALPAPDTRGKHEPLHIVGEQPQGVVLCTRDLHNPVYVSPGHRITLQESIDWVLQATGRCRLPEPIRRAHTLAGHTRSPATPRETTKCEQGLVGTRGKGQSRRSDAVDLVETYPG